MKIKNIDDENMFKMSYVIDYIVDNDLDDYEKESLFLSNF